MPPATSGAASAGRSAASAREHLLGLLGPVVAATGYDLEDVTVTSAGRRSLVRVIVDADGGVDLDAVAEVSRAVSDALDADGRADRLRRPVRARGQLARRRPSAHRAAALAPRRRAAGRRSRSAATGHRPGARRRRRGVQPATSTATRALESRWAELGAAGSRSSSTATSRRRRRDTDARRLSRWFNVDIAALRSIEREKEISFDTLDRRARDGAADRLQAHRRTRCRTPASRSTARPARSSCGRRSSAPDGELDRGVRRHPDRLRPGRGDDRPAGDPAAAARRRARPDLRRVLRARGRHRHRRRPGRRAGRRSAASCSSTSARSRRSCRRPSRCRARTTPTAPGCKCYVVGVHPRHARPAGHASAAPTRTWCKQAVRARGARDRRRQRRDRRRRPRGRAPHQDRGPHRRCPG